MNGNHILIPLGILVFITLLVTIISSIVNKRKRGQWSTDEPDNWSKEAGNYKSKIMTGSEMISDTKGEAKRFKELQEWAEKGLTPEEEELKKQYYDSESVKDIKAK